MRLGMLLAALLFVGACAGAGEQGERDMSESMDQALAASMEVKVSSSSVRFILHVTNSGDEPIEVLFPTSQRYDFVVRTPAGDEVWRWSDGMGFLQALSNETLAPGESWEMEAVWDPGDRTGEFVAVGELKGRDLDLLQRTTFEL